MTDIDDHGLRPSVFITLWVLMFSASSTISGTLLYLLWKGITQ